MRIGGSLFLIAVGAILKFAVQKQINGIDLNMIGLILLIVGIIGLLISLIMMSMRRRTDIIQHGPGGDVGTTYLRPNDPVDPRY